MSELTSATTARAVRVQARAAADLGELSECIEACRACKRLVRWREDVAATKRRAYADQDYWGRAVAGFGDAHPRVLIVGLAPAAHGANRTGRVFTGDRSGDWLFAALHRAGVASQSHSVSADDGMQLRHVRIVAAVRCAPPANKPTPAERDACAPWLDRELDLVAPSLRSVLALGSFGWGAALTALARAGWDVPSPAPKFGHAVAVRLDSSRGRAPVTLVGCYHVSQQNTFTGRLTETMLDSAINAALSA